MYLLQAQPGGGGFQFLFLALVIGVLAWYLYSRNKRIKKLKAQYDQALLGTDRRAALLAGRAYYSALRGKGTLTVYDEQAITNDLNTMSQQVHS